MKPDSERTKRYFAKRHQTIAYLHAHLSKDLRKKLKVKKRALLVHKGDKVKVMRGLAKGKTAKITSVDYNKSLIYLEGITHHSARGKESPMAMQPSNLLLIELETTPERKTFLGEAAVAVQTSAPTHAAPAHTQPASHPTPAHAPAHPVPAQHTTHTESTHTKHTEHAKHEAKQEAHHEKHAEHKTEKKVKSD